MIVGLWALPIESTERNILSVSFIPESGADRKLDQTQIAELRRDGLSWSQVCRTLKVSKGSAQRSVATIA